MRSFEKNHDQEKRAMYVKLNIQLGKETKNWTLLTDRVLKEMQL